MKSNAGASIVSRLFDVGNYVLLILLGLITVGPFLYLIAGSLTNAAYYRTAGVSINPVNWTLDAYRILLGGSSRVYQALKVTLFITIVGTFFSILVTAALAYGISKRELPGHKFFVFFVFFTMRFGGGMVPFYLVVKGLGLVNTLWSLIIPFLVNAWYMFIMVQFFRSLPRELEDAARIDGCSELAIFMRIVLPLSLPVLSTVGLYYAVGYWNQWFWAIVFLTDDQLSPLQLILRDVLSQMLFVTDPELSIEQALMDVMPPGEVLRMATIIVTVLPITLVYPFLQRYFVKGVMIGAIKG